jgi:excisionase family DNA binding protein
MEQLLLEAADVLAIGRTTVYELMRTDRLATVRIGRCRRIPAAALRSYVDSLMPAGEA